MAAQIRRACPEDAAAMAAVHVKSWQVAYRGLMPDEILDGQSVEKRQGAWKQALEAEPNLTAYVAVEEEIVVAFCAVAAPSRDDDAGDGVAEVTAIYVAPTAWRAGHGRALMDAALADLRAGGWRWLTLWVLAENQQARAFYGRFGLHEDGAEMTHQRSGLREVRLRSPIEV